MIMRKIFLVMVIVTVCLCSSSILSRQAPNEGGNQLQEDIIKTETGDIKLTFIGHASLIFTYQQKVIHIDPVSREGDYTSMPKADLILITHEHGDHLDPSAIEIIKKEDTRIVLSGSCADKVSGGTILHNSDTLTIGDLGGIKIEAVPAYNIVHTRSGGVPYHPKGVGNGYIVTLGKTRIYVAGDTENTPEMKKLTNIDIAFLPMNLPYTMSPEMVADAARAFAPKTLYPYHYSNTNTDELLELMKDFAKTEIRIRDLQ